MLTVTACATVQHGPVQRIAVDSEPQGALVRTVDCGPGSTEEVKTPGVVWVSRRAEHCTLTFSAPDHYAEQVTLSRQVAQEFYENGAVGLDIASEDVTNVGWLFLGGLFAGTGFALDAATGALFEQRPSELFLELEPVQAREEPSAEEAPEATGVVSSGADIRARAPRSP